MNHYPEIRDLQLLLALSLRKHFAHAAEDCSISQPAFSARIRKLEDELGVPIVRRGNKFLGLTKDGEMVLKWARKILMDAEGLRQDIEIAKNALRGTLALGVVPSALPYSAMISAKLRALFPNLTIQIQSLTSNRIASGLREFSLDAGITYHDERDLGSLNFDPIYEENCVLLCPAKLAPRITGEISWKEAANLPLCLLSKDMRFRQNIDGVFQSVGVRPQPVMETNAFTAALAQVASGTAASIVPQCLMDTLIRAQDCVSLPLVNPHKTHTIGLATTNHEPILAAVVALADVIKSLK